ncbi:MAG: DUF1549 domain-containing protein, partial [Planctomycetales bacterium]
MKHAAVLLSLLCVACVVPVARAADADSPEANQEGIAFFEKKIRPVLAAQCYKCHAADSKKVEGELLLDTREGIRKGGETGPAVVPGKVAESLLIMAIRHDEFEMPPKSKLSAQVIADFTKWVEIGAPDPRDGKSQLQKKSTINIAEGKKFWSYRPLGNPAPPKVKDASWIATDVDRFILGPLESKGVSPNPIADRTTLIRRVYFDLWGLPPEPAEVESFVNDPDPKAYEKLIDRLLAADHFGERWARHWLDLARFAESNGYAFDKDRNGAYHYRDFVIKALNADMPYDEFIHLQIAGDQLDSQNPMAQAATGFLASGPFTSQQTQKERERSRYEQLDDLLSTIGTATLGLTIGCARCHDHKFDPVGMQDYYRMVSCFAETGFQDFDHDPDLEGTKRAKAEFDKQHAPFTQGRVQYEKEKLPARLAEWINTKSAPPSTEKLGVWHAIGPFPAADFKAAFTKIFEPEKKVTLDKPQGKLSWKQQPAWADGQVHNTLTGENSANYLYRTIEVMKGRKLEISLGSDDAIKVFLNGKSVLAKEAQRGAAADQEKVVLNLRTGKNDLLLKIVNGAGPSGFYFSTKAAATPKNIQDILNLAEDKRTPQHQQ